MVTFLHKSYNAHVDLVYYKKLTDLVCTMVKKHEVINVSKVCRSFGQLVLI